MDSHTPQPDQRYDDEISLREVWGLLRRNLWLILFCLVTVAGGTAWYTFTTVPVWDAETVLRIDEDSPSLPVLDSPPPLPRGAEVRSRAAQPGTRPLPHTRDRPHEVAFDVRIRRHARRSQNTLRDTHTAADQ